MKLEHGIAITKRLGGNCRDAAQWALARLAMKRGDTADALEKVNTSLQFNASNHLAMGLKALALANSGRTKEAQAYIVVCLEQYPLSYPLHCARWMIAPGDESRAGLLRVTGRRGSTAACWRAGCSPSVRSRRRRRCLRFWIAGGAADAVARLVKR